eukprot:TRINITY_DN24840_c0_g1_i1.p1 TRINITY_DN24840_c0_g1~~TRINITY_DN24840_c0_g1_i1.p1  ORF type:complete len:604 (-),score=265.68 TRINITY_DN24840_c0_g1_i1:51-1700(-)
MAEKAGIPIPEVRDESLDTSMVEEGVEVNSRTAFLPQEEVVTAYMSECLSPSHFYLHRVAFVDILNRLEKDITDWVEKENIPSYNFRPKEEEIVLVRAQGETFFSRARVVKLLGSRQVEEDDVEPRVEEMIQVFLVDTGMVVDVSTTDMAQCKVEFVERLPFQAIRCSLAEVGPVDKEWSSEAGDRLFDLTRDVETDEAMVVECLVVEKMEDQYRVKLRKGVAVDLALDLVESGLAAWLDSSVESSFDSHVHENEKKLEDTKEDILSEVSKWDIPNGLPEDVLNMDELYSATKDGCEQYLEDQLGSVPVHQPPTTASQFVTPSIPTIPIKLSSSSTLPTDMPSLAIVTGLTSCQSVVPQMVWSQDHQTVFLRVTITSMMDIPPGQVFVGVKDQELTVQVLEVDVSNAGELYTLHQTPPLKLYGKVDPLMTRVVVLARGLTITLGKQRSLFWMQLSRQKFGWIKKDPNACLDSDSDSEPVVTGQPEPGFISPYLTQSDVGRAGGHGKRYHPLTGEEILPEPMWMSSDQESEEEELGYIHDKALEFNPNIL